MLPHRWLSLSTFFRTIDTRDHVGLKKQLEVVYQCLYHNLSGLPLPTFICSIHWFIGKLHFSDFSLICIRFIHIYGDEHISFRATFLLWFSVLVRCCENSGFVLLVCCSVYIWCQPATAILAEWALGHCGVTNVLFYSFNSLGYFLAKSEKKT